jgi:hypothetical protein
MRPQAEPLDDGVGVEVAVGNENGPLGQLPGYVWRSDTFNGE